MRFFLVVILLCLVPAIARAQQQKQLPHYEGRYYIIYTDLSGDDLREAELRMAKMAEEYHNRTKDFSGDIRTKFPFHLFRNENDYYAAGGKPGSAGMFNPNDNTLMAIVVGDHVDQSTWNVVQHEGFHQFARAVIGGELPVWVNEGLAEYFGEGIFTGDSFVTGVVPPERLDRVKKQMRTPGGKGFRSIKEMMLLAHADWNADLSLGNYDEAWSMVHFLAHAENGKYQTAFVNFMRAIGKGHQWEQAWLANFGSAEGFQAKWEHYWLNIEPAATAPLYVKANVLTLTSALARGVAQKQKFNTFDDLASAVKQGKLKIDPRDWLPAKLIQEAFADASEMRQRGYSFELAQPPGRPPAIVCKLKDGSKMIGTFKLQSGRVAEVTAAQVAH